MFSDPFCWSPLECPGLEEESQIHLYMQSSSIKTKLKPCVLHPQLMETVALSLVHRLTRGQSLMDEGTFCLTKQDLTSVPRAHMKGENQSLQGVL